MKGRHVRIWLVPVLALLAVLAAGMSGILDRQETWADLTDPDDVDMVFFENGFRQSLEEGNEYGAISSGPWFILPAGHYRVKWTIWGDGDNRIVLATQNHARMDRSEHTIPAGMGIGEFEFELMEPAEGFELQVFFDQGTRINVEDLRLYSPRYKDDVLTLAGVLAVLCVLWVRHCRGRSLSEVAFVLLIGFAVLYASAPALREGTTLYVRTQMEVGRICNLADGLRSRGIQALLHPVRWGGYLFNGFGSVASAVMPDMALLLPAGLLLLGCSVQYALNATYILMSALSALTMYRCAMGIFHRRWTAVMASILYVLSAYRISSLFVYGNLGESAVLALMPLVCLGIWQIVHGDVRRWPLFAASGALMVLCDQTGVLGLGLMLTVALVGAGRLREAKRAGMLALSLLFVAGIALHWIVPAMSYLKDGIQAPGLTSAGERAVSPAQLLLWGHGEYKGYFSDPTLTLGPVEPGLLTLCGLGLVICETWLKKQREAGGKEALLLLASGLLGLLAAMGGLPRAGSEATTAGAVFLTWRMAGPAMTFLCLSAAWGFHSLGRKWPELTTLAVLVLGVFLILPTTTAQLRTDNYLGYGRIPRTTPSDAPRPAGAGLDRVYENQPFLEGGADTSVSMTRDSREMRVSFSTGEEARLVLPLFLVDGLHAELNGSPVALEGAEGKRAAVRLPAVRDGQVRVFYQDRPVWRVLDGVSLAFALGLLAFSLRGCPGLRRRGRPGGSRSGA